jgi:hypothetical protein
MAAEKFQLIIDVRDANNNIIENSNGVKEPSLRLEMTFSDGTAELALRSLHRTLQSWMPNNKIDIEAFQNNSIGGTLTSVYSLYGPENRFVKHT